MSVLKVKKDSVWEEVGGISGHTHTTTDITNFPSSLPADGGNADTVDGKHASDFAAAADVAAVGNRLAALSEDIANLQTSGLTTAQVNALDGMFKVCAFTKADISAEYTAFKTAFGIADSGGEETGDGTEWAGGVPYVYTLVENEYVGLDNTGGDGIKTYAGWSRTPFLPCKGASEITVTYIDNTQNKLNSSYGVWYDADKKYITNFNQTNIPYTVPTDACFVIFSQVHVVMTNIASITPHE